MGPLNSSTSGESSPPILGLLIGVPLSLCIWGLLATVALLAAF